MSDSLLSLLPLLGIALLFWLLLIRPASRRAREQARMQSSLQTGQEVMLTSGIYGTLRELADDHVLVEVAEGVLLKVARGAVGSVVRTDEPDAGAASGSAESTEER